MLATGGLLVAGALVAGPVEASKPPHATGVSCVERCAGARQVGIGAKVRVTGHRLDATAEVRFPTADADEIAAPIRVTKRAVEVVVPARAVSGRPLVVDASGHGGYAPRLEIVGDAALLAPEAFRLARSSARPRNAFFDQRRPVRLRYRFRSRAPRDVRVTVVRRGGEIRTWTERDRAPFASQAIVWNGLTGGGAVGPEGRYRFRVGPVGAGQALAGRFRFHAHRFPVRGPHSYGDRFGAPRSGGRVHEGQDLWAGCGTRLEAARGGRVQFRGYSGALYGHYLVVDGRHTDRDYMYSHLIRPPRVNDGDRVRTGELIGAVGRSGNARGEGCQLHFELWPNGWHHGRPADPLRELRRWDRFS